MTLYSLFRHLSESQKNYRIHVSYYEIYNEHVYDLLEYVQTVKKIMSSSKPGNAYSPHKFGTSKNSNHGSQRNALTQLEIREDIHKKVIIKDLKKVECKGWKDALAVFNKGEKQRSYAITKMNHQSSRSHVIFQIEIEMKLYEKHIISKCPRIYLVDLAGNESINKSGIDLRSQIQESSNINKSLLALTRVIGQINRVTQKSVGFYTCLFFIHQIVVI